MGHQRQENDDDRKQHGKRSNRTSRQIAQVVAQLKRTP
jgi:hypothetical protein